MYVITAVIVVITEHVRESPFCKQSKMQVGLGTRAERVGMLALFQNEIGYSHGQIARPNKHDNYHGLLSLSTSKVTCFRTTKGGCCLLRTLVKTTNLFCTLYLCVLVQTLIIAGNLVICMRWVVVGYCFY